MADVAFSIDSENTTNAYVDGALVSAGEILNLSDLISDRPLILTYQRKDSIVISMVR